MCPKIQHVTVTGYRNATEQIGAVTDSPPGGGRVIQDCLMQSHSQSHSHQCCSDVLALGGWNICLSLPGAVQSLTPNIPFDVFKKTTENSISLQALNQLLYNKTKSLNTYCMYIHVQVSSFVIHRAHKDCIPLYLQLAGDLARNGFVGYLDLGHISTPAEVRGL